MTNPFYDPYRVLSRVYQDGAHLKLALLEEQIEELHRARTVKTVYGVLENDGYLSLCIATFTQKQPKAAIRILLKIALYWLVFLEKPRYMVTDTAVSLLKKMGKGGASGFVNAFLRTFDASKVILPEGDEGLAIRSNFPLFALSRLRKTYGERTENIVLAKSAGVSVRFVRGAEKYSSRPHIETPFEGVWLFQNFARDRGYDEGDYTFQSVGSVAICDTVEPCETLLDACAAPGGKSVLLSSKCAHVTACELHPHRAELIRSYAKRMGKEIAVVEADSSLFRPEWEGAFEGVLCDVPCTGLGTVSENPDLPLRKREEDLENLLSCQRAILQNCSRYVAVGGALYYSTCSVLEEENEGCVSSFLAKNTAFRAEEISSPLPFERTAHGIQFLPDTAYGAGFFVAKMRRLR